MMSKFGDGTNRTEHVLARRSVSGKFSNTSVSISWSARAFRLLTAWRESSAAEAGAGGITASALHRVLQSPPASPALQALLTGENPSFPEDDLPLIFPFGSNAGQREAVRRALTNTVSVLEGPPGTGKTQTLLNLIANWLIRGKTVAVAAPANAAANNVAEKLAAAGFGWLTAALGNRTRRTAFFAAAHPIPALTMPEDVPTDSDLKSALTSLEALAAAAACRDRAVAELKRLTFEKTVFLEEEAAAGRFPEKDPRYRELRHVVNLDWRSLDRWARWSASSWWWQRWWGRRQLRRQGFSKKMSLADLVSVLELLRIDRRTAVLTLQKGLAAPGAAQYEARKATYRRLSDAWFRAWLCRHRADFEAASFDEKTYRQTPSFYWRFPVVTTSAVALPLCAPNKGRFDVLILDEAGQLSPAVAAAALAVSSRVTAAGDTRQLATVTSGTPAILPDIPAPYAGASSALSLMKALFSETVVLLREHYRCHPDIIEFCSRRYYHGELVAKTSAEGRPPALRWIECGEQAVVKTAGSLWSPRQRAVTAAELQRLRAAGIPVEDVAVIAPYRGQVQQSGETADTVHRFQGREKEVVIFNTVRNRATAFNDDPRLINVAVSRAKSLFVLVAPACAARGDSNVAALIRYMTHLDPRQRQLTTSPLRSVFDALYRGEPLSGGCDGESPAERILRERLMRLLKARFPEWRFVQEYPLRLIPKTTAGFPDEWVRFMMNGSRLDFLLYDVMNNAPVAAVEVDGAAFHKMGTRQAERDRMKDAILHRVGLPLLRLPTDSVSGNEEERLAAFLTSVKTAKAATQQ